MTPPEPTMAPSADIPVAGPVPTPSVGAFVAGLAEGLGAQGRTLADPADPGSRAALSRVRAMLGRALDREPRPPAGERAFLRIARLALAPGPTRDNPGLGAVMATRPRPLPGTPYVAEAVDAYLGRAPAVAPQAPRPGHPPPSGILRSVMEAIARHGAALARHVLREVAARGGGRAGGSGPDGGARPGHAHRGDPTA